MADPYRSRRLRRPPGCSGGECSMLATLGQGGGQNSVCHSRLCGYIQFCTIHSAVSTKTDCGEISVRNFVGSLINGSRFKTGLESAFDTPEAFNEVWKIWPPKNDYVHNELDLSNRASPLRLARRIPITISTHVTHLPQEPGTSSLLRQKARRVPPGSDLPAMRSRQMASIRRFPWAMSRWTRSTPRRRRPRMRA